MKRPAHFGLGTGAFTDQISIVPGAIVGELEVGDDVGLNGTFLPPPRMKNWFACCWSRLSSSYCSVVIVCLSYEKKGLPKRQALRVVLRVGVKAA
jgi:hypothetical protein